MEVTVLHGLYKIQKGHIDLVEVLGQIKSGVYASQIFKCRTALTKEAYNKAKVNLPCFTPSGRFGQAWKTDKKKEEKRPIPPTKRHLIEYNGIVVLDYDDLEEVEMFQLMDTIRSCKYTFSSFNSPSDKGYKVLVKTTNKDPEQHANAFKAVREFFFELTGVQDDKSSSNINRLCFVSLDGSLFLNENSTLFEFQPTLFEVEQKEVIQHSPTSSNGNGMEDITKVVNKVEKDGFAFVEGQRHEYRVRFSMECVKYGISKEECLSFVESSLVTASTNLNKAKSAVEWAYDNIKEVGIYANWADENTIPKKPLPKKEYKPELFKETKEKDDTISLPELSNSEIDNLEKKVKNSILFYKRVEETLDEYFEFRINTLKNREEYRQKGWKEFRELDKLEYNSIARALKYHGVTCSTKVLEGIILSDFSNKVHPLKEKFEGWSKQFPEDKNDYIKQVANLVQTDAPKGLFESVFKKWVVASVANVYVENQCTNHHCLILCGDQGTGKTTFFKSLFSPEYVFTGHLDLRNKDSLILLTDTFLVVIDEQFSVLSKDSEWESLKSAVTMPMVKARWHYAKTSKLAPRVANVCGTSNRRELLQDDTGNRRFITFWVTNPIDINKLQGIDLRKMWAQAYRLFKNSWYYLPTLQENLQIEKYQNGFKKLKNEHYLIMDAFEPYDKDDEHLELWSSKEIWVWMDKFYTIGKEVTIPIIGRAMRALGFIQKTTTRASDNKRSRYWLLKNKIGAKNSSY